MLEGVSIERELVPLITSDIGVYGKQRSSSSIYWTGPFPGVKSPIEACALGGGSVCSLKTVNIKTKLILKR